MSFFSVNHCHSIRTRKRTINTLRRRPEILFHLRPTFNMPLYKMYPFRRVSLSLRHLRGRPLALDQAQDIVTEILLRCLLLQITCMPYQAHQAMSIPIDHRISPGSTVRTEEDEDEIVHDPSQEAPVEEAKEAWIWMRCYSLLHQQTSNIFRPTGTLFPGNPSLSLAGGKTDRTVVSFTTPEMERSLSIRYLHTPCLLTLSILLPTIHHTILWEVPRLHLTSLSILKLLLNVIHRPSALDQDPLLLVAIEKHLGQNPPFVTI